MKFQNVRDTRRDIGFLHNINTINVTDGTDIKM